MNFFDKNSLFGVIIGSVVTLMIKFVSDYFLKKQGYDRSLKKFFFEKKIEQAETHIAGLTTSIQASTILKYAIEGLIDEEIDGAHFGRLWEDNHQKLIKAEEHMSLTSGQLYFDLNSENNWTEDDQKDLLECTSALGVYFEYANNYEKLQRSDLTKKELEELDKAIDGFLKPNIIEELEKLSDLLDDYIEASYEVIKSIKKDLFKSK